jgi:type I restriction enzyme S subunit
MKPSGIDWLGEIPAHWGIQPLKYQSAKIGSGKTPRGGAEVYVSTGVVLLRSQNIHDEGMRLEDLVFIDDETDQEMANSRVKPGDVLLNITGASIGRCSIAPDNLPKANVNQHVCIIRPRKIKTEFLHAILCSKEIKDWIQSHENGTSREGLNFRQVGNVRIPIPPEAEQNEIVSRLQKRTSQLDKLMKSVDEAIDKLRDYRSALITAAVTGQIDVRQLGKEAP